MKLTTETQVVKNVAEMRRWYDQIKAGKTASEKPLLGVVPTMGALHEGHLTLIRQAVKECQHVVVTIFVNPMQFGPNEDLSKYPRPFERDLELCRKAGAEIVFHPGPEEIYQNGTGSGTKVVPPSELTERLCGLVRPDHFTGVATIVLKLFSIVRPDKAYFGEKDYQQLSIIKRMVKDFDLPLTIVPVPTVREADGLALSSRNVYLSPEERKLAPGIYQALCTVRDGITIKGWSLTEALKAARENLERIPNLSIQYLEACDPDSLEPLSKTKLPTVVLVAAKLGNVRLIDNIVISDLERDLLLKLSSQIS